MVETLNLNNILENNLEDENQDEIFDSSRVSLNIDDSTVVLEVDEFSHIMFIGSKSTYYVKT